MKRQQNTPTQKLNELTRQTNLLRREAHQHDIVSPFRQSVYINHRLSGKSVDESIDLTRNKEESR